MDARKASMWDTKGVMWNRDSVDTAATIFAQTKYPWDTYSAAAAPAALRWTSRGYPVPSLPYLFRNEVRPNITYTG